jgi:ABC-type multidrug transport system ATPase subunit
VGADQILVIEKGEVIERGTHSELLELNGKYYELWTKQTDVTMWSNEGSQVASANELLIDVMSPKDDEAKTMGQDVAGEEGPEEAAEHGGGHVA